MWRFYKWQVIYNTDKIRAFWKPCLKSWEILFSLSLCLFKKKFCQMCEKSEFLWRERPVLYHVMPFRSSNYTNFSNYIWYGISKKRHVYLLKLPTIESVNKKNLNIRRIVQNFLIIFWISCSYAYWWRCTWTYTSIIFLMYQSYNILHLISFFCR